MADEVRSSSVGSFAPHTVGVVFDLAKEADTLAVLKSVHRSAIDPDTKNELRDAVFDYRQGFDQAALTHACELFASVGISVVGCGNTEGTYVPEDIPREENPRNGSRLWGGRKSAFGRPASKVESRATHRGPAHVSVPVHIEASSAPEPEVIPAAQPVSPEPEVVVAVAEPVVEKPTPAPEPEPIVVTPEVPQTIPTVTVESAVPSAPSGLRPMDRINEIKKIINEKIGNPVNLIAAHNDIGREYMNALLEAMKKSNGGQGDELAAAMTRLETAFSAVITVLDTPAQLTPTPEPVVETPVAVEAKPVAEAAPVEVPAPPTVEAEPFVMPPPPLESMILMASDVQAVQELATPQVVEVPKEAVPQVPAENTKPQGTQVVSVAKAKQVEELMHKQFVEAAEREETSLRTAESKMDPIMVSEVTTGLRQLLSEWTLFKSSGLFGTGPSGIDHPLYKKLNTLPMQAVIAGRFEGSTTQIRQSISDYMNGWRYEEGVVFDYGESFEHYLRRVIRHILDKKKKVAEPAK